MNLDDFAREANTRAQTDQTMAAIGDMAKLLGAYRRALLTQGFTELDALSVVLGYQAALFLRGSHEPPS